MNTEFNNDYMSKTMFGFYTCTKVQFETNGDRILMAYYTDNRYKYGYRIDFNHRDNVIQMNRITDGIHTAISRIQFTRVAD